MRRTIPTRVGDLVGDWLRDSPTIARKIAEAKVADCWPAVAGPAAARCTASTEMKGGTFYVHLTSSVVRSELAMRRTALKEALNRAVGVEVVRNLSLK